MSSYPFACLLSYAEMLYSKEQIQNSPRSATSPRAEKLSSDVYSRNEVRSKRSTENIQNQPLLQQTFVRASEENP